MKKQLLSIFVILIMLLGCNSSDIQGNSQAASEGDQNSQSEPEKELDDNRFIESTYNILQSFEIPSINKESLTVVRQESERYNRLEVVVSFSQEEHNGNAIFHAETGALLVLECFDFEFNALSDYNKNSPEEKAAEYYNMLPVPQGYILTNSDAPSEIHGIYRFSRQIGEGIYNQYQQVIITINTDNGHFIMCAVHDFPLANGYNQNDKTLTQDEAEAIAQAFITQRWPDWPGRLQTAEITAVLPNRNFKEYSDESSKYPDNTYLVWQLTYENKGSETADILKIYVDLYSGKVLGGDGTALKFTVE